MGARTYLEDFFIPVGSCLIVDRMRSPQLLHNLKFLIRARRNNRLPHNTISPSPPPRRENKTHLRPRPTRKNHPQNTNPPCPLKQHRLSRLERNSTIERVPGRDARTGETGSFFVGEVGRDGEEAEGGEGAVGLEDAVNWGAKATYISRDDVSHLGKAYGKRSGG